MGLGAFLLIASLALGAASTISSIVQRPPSPPQLPPLDIPDEDEEDLVRERAAEAERLRIVSAAPKRRVANVRSLGQVIGSEELGKGKLLGV